MDEIIVFLDLKFVSSLSLYDSMNSVCAETVSARSVFSSDPLFSCAITFCTLVFLYLPPHLFLKIVFSPVLILTWILLLAILRLGAAQKSQHEQKENRGKCYEENRGSKEEKQSSSPIEPKETNSPDQVQNWISSQVSFKSSSFFVEWDVKAPLEVIYEEYEGEEEDETDEKEGNQRYPSLSRYYPESDSDSSSSENGFPATGEWYPPENNCLFRWDDEEDREGLIEIALDGCKSKRDMEFNFEEENLIEIDISPMRYKELSGEDEVFPVRFSCH